MNQPDVVFFDMDHTVLSIDADVSWKNFLADEGLAPDDDRTKAKYYWNLYIQGRSPVEEFVQFQLREFIGHTLEEMRMLARHHFEKRLHPHIYPEARHVIFDYSENGIPTLLLTGTNRIIAEPVAEALGITALLATEPEIIEERFSGGIIGPFLSKEEKLKKARDHCESIKSSLLRAAFFADSINDLELLESVGFPVAVNPAENLLSVARAQGWRIESWSLT